MTAGSAPVLHVTVNAATNRFTGTYTYDLNGNLSYGGSADANYAYDIENRMIRQWNTTTGTSELHSYGPDNQRVWKRRSDGSEQVTFYGVGGERMAVYQPISSSSGVLTGGGDQLYFAGRPVSYGSDRLGSKRADSPNTQGQTIAYTYFPYGEEYTTTTQDTDKFGTYFRDSTTALDYARNRYYSNRLARFLTADPYRASGGLADPGSWNRYAYVGGDPVNFKDPGGLYKCVVGVGEGAEVTECEDITLIIFWSPVGSRGPAPHPLSRRKLADRAKHLKQAVNTGAETDCEALADFASAAAENLVGDKQSRWQFKTDFAVLTPSQFPTYLLPGISTSSGSDFVLLNATQQPSGFKSKYQDEIPNADQAHHFAAFFQLGFINGAAVAGKAAEWWEKLNGSPGNVGDINLGIVAAQMGADLKAGEIDPSDLASLILTTLCK